VLRASNFPCQHAPVRRRWKILLLAATGLVAVWAIWFVGFRKKEPSYNGKPLSEWLEKVSSYKPPAERDQARKAVVAIGTNAVPYLLEWCNERNFSRREWWVGVHNKLNAFVSVDAMVNRFISRNSLQFNDAVIGFQILGTNATIALPELVRRFDTSTNVAFVYYTAFLIGHLGKPGLDFLIPVLQNKSDTRRDIVLQVIGETVRYFVTADEAKPAVPIMLSIMNDVSDPLAPQAAAQLGKLGAAPERVVPQLINALRSTNISMRASAISGLMEFRTNASAAIPALQKATNDSDATVRSLALAALPLIAPQALTNAALRRE
jgi:hypothetical protein